jgi:mycobactin lysine-N-oxygenase
LRGFRTLAGRALAIEAGHRQVVVTIGYGDERERVSYDVVIVASGFDGHWFERLLSDEARQRLADAQAGDELERRIDVNLAVAGLDPPLHLPMLAGLAQGPGFPNLTCLGLLSDRVLRRYVPLASPAPVLNEETHRV